MFPITLNELKAVLELLSNTTAEKALLNVSDKGSTDGASGRTSVW
jgi:hypothetical protein